MTPGLVIFDCDGVLVDSERISHEVLCEMLAEQGVSLPFDEAVRRFMGSSVPLAIEHLGELLGRPAPQDWLDEMLVRTREAFQAGLTPVPGVLQVLEALEAAGCPYCVASNGNHAKVRFTLGLTGLLPRFEGRIFTADDVARPKPAPDLFLLAAAALGVAPADAVVVEDSPTGVTAAKAAGMRVIGYAAMTGEARLRAAGADEVVATMAEVALGWRP